MSSTAVILFAHGAREPEWAQPFEAVRHRLREAGMQVVLAFLEFMSPSLDEAAAKLADKGIKTVIIVLIPLSASFAAASSSVGDMNSRKASTTCMPASRSRWRTASNGCAHSGSRAPWAKRMTAVEDMERRA